MSINVHTLYPVAINKFLNTIVAFIVQRHKVVRQLTSRLNGCDNGGRKERKDNCNSNEKPHKIPELTKKLSFSWQGNYMEWVVTATNTSCEYERGKAKHRLGYCHEIQIICVNFVKQKACEKDRLWMAVPYCITCS